VTTVPTAPTAPARRAGAPMSLWRLEWFRLVRTHRLLALVAVDLFFGLTSPPLARYMGEILERFSSGVQVIAPPPTPGEGLTTFVGNTNQIGLLVYVLVVASAVAFDSQREMAVFLRTRVRSYRELLVPKYLLSVAAGAGAFTLGALATWYGTIFFLGDVDAAGMLAGILLAVLYLAFIGAVAAMLGARLSSVLTTAVGTLAVAVALGIVGSLGSIGDWLPSHLLGALSSLPLGGDAGSYLRCAAVTVVATLGLLAAAARLGEAREL
jgi:ABC-2 type transport system permease protein